MELIIRKALPQDAFDYTDCVVSCWQSAYKVIVPEEFLLNMSAQKDQLLDKYKKALTDPGDCDYYCVMDAEKMVGFLIIRGRNESKLGEGEIWAIYLIEKYCGKGFGKVLLDFVMTKLKNMGNRKISLWVLEGNMRARRFYEKNGFCFDGTKREREYGRPLVQLKYVLTFQ